MPTIDVVPIAVNRYAPAGSEAITMYDTGASGPLTIGQLVQAVCLRSAAVYEAQSVIKMNMMTSGSEKLDRASSYLERIMSGNLDWNECKTYLTTVLGIPASALPDRIDEYDGATKSAYDRRMQAATALKEKVDALTQSQQEDMIDLQSLVNRRDNACSTSSNIVRTLGNSSADNAQNF